MRTGKKIKVYIVSFVLAPFGLYYFFKYFRHEDPSYRKEGYKALLITITALFVSALVLYKYLDAYGKYFDVYRSNMEIYDSLGY